MIGDKDLLAFRQGYYDLFVSLFWKEPRAELLGGLTEGIEERIQAGRHLHPLLGEGWAEIGRFLEGADRERLAEAVAGEYTRLFIGPRDPEINPYESYYLTGRLLDRPLAILRNFLREVGLEKQGEYAEPEDFLASELEIMRRLIARQAVSPHPDEEVRELNVQAAFLKRHLLVWAPTAAKDLADAEGALFYRGVAKLLLGFLELERDLFEGWGEGGVRALGEARQSFAHGGEWKGPLFEV